MMWWVVMDGRLLLSMDEMFHCDGGAERLHLGVYTTCVATDAVVFDYWHKQNSKKIV
jgi:hypothetical protein